MFIEETQDDSDDWMSALLRSPIFQRLPPTNLQKILMSLEAVHFNKGEVIVDQGTMGDYYYLIKNGHCELTRKPSPNAKEIKLARMSAGDTFGEDSLLSDAPRNGSIRALTDISLLRLNKPQFVSLIKEPSLAFVNYTEMQEVVKQGAILLDVRTPDEYESNHIDGSINEPFFSLRMQLKTLDKEKPIIVVCSDGKTSEAAVFLLLRNKINAMILKGGMAGINPEPKHDATPSGTTDDIEVVLDRPEMIHQECAVKQPDNNVSASNNAQDEHIRLLQLEIEALKMTNQQLNDKCMKLEFDKQNAEKQARLMHKQLEKLTQVLDKLKAGE
ncbi:cyclic nucleotide-binding domain-containing protein [Methylobacter sp.]|uniref:cyclic nucleotide-binding domain-containing protein n=1 Tax=Methylobacter sp. TaxID=2051955 RepID=UPI00121A3791|nr:cyclic nucleotide-binding domain-containing protein [Methylobacter sp.]TAK65027.1 MAG: cyclic nucleotide-binding domain-containing protein [Methylobacter sp.]